MTRNDGPEPEADLVEPTGVNAGPQVDAEPGSAPDRGHHDDRDAEGDTDDTAAAGDPAAGPPGQWPGVSGTLSDEMAGLPEQRPGHPGQQRSVDTS